MSASESSQDGSDRLSGGKWDKMLAEEQAYQHLSTPPHEMPSCMNLFDNWASCFGELSGHMG